MKADTFAKLVILETLIDAEIGYWLEERPAASERFREGMISRISDLVDEVDALDAVAAARVYDAVVDFLSELPDDDDDGVVESTLRFKRAIDRITDRGMEERELTDPSTWAVVLDELLEALADEYHTAVRASGEVRQREYQRARHLVARARDAADRMVAHDRPPRRAEVRDEMDRLAFAVRNRRLKPAALDVLMKGPQRLARRYRPSNLTRIGAFVVGQLLRKRGGEAGGA